jgi:hypothetical protein
MTRLSNNPIMTFPTIAALHVYSISWAVAAGDILSTPLFGT